jgi:hypothetical protein
MQSFVLDHVKAVTTVDAAMLSVGAMVRCEPSTWVARRCAPRFGKPHTMRLLPSTKSENLLSIASPIGFEVMAK